MKQVLMFLKVVTAPAWVPLWLMKKGVRLFAVLVLGAVLAGCATTSNQFDKSPCACDFKQLNTGNYGSKANA
ncbi:hypothetical protein AC028_21510 (plasmid) [Xanthomonas citri pv. aurantifolii]|nr:hypothetical protein AC028_21510 [Xanthomonas citri pv. aurantifolii]ARE58994.1 hypothetical protein TP45_21860 [Xanthomonas citri pv. aurantifolii]MBV6816267.1 hypothetical protein [Xanthomonas campestris pv. passiflorae]